MFLCTYSKFSLSSLSTWPCIAGVCPITLGFYPMSLSLKASIDRTYNAFVVFFTLYSSKQSKQLLIKMGRHWLRRKDQSSGRLRVAISIPAFEVSLSKTPNPQLLLTSWLVSCMAANCRWCVNETQQFYSDLDKGAI